MKTAGGVDALPPMLFPHRPDSSGCPECFAHQSCERRPHVCLHTTPRSGFTLVELLTVIAIVGALLAILTPVVGKARGSARNAQCVGNLREIGAAAMLYAHDNHDRLPAPGDPTGDPASTWIAALHRYTGAPFPVSGGDAQLASVSPLFRCPEWSFIDESAQPTVQSYAFRAESVGGTVNWTRQRALSDIRDPSRTLLAIEHEETAFAATTAAWTNGGNYVSSPAARGALRHGGHANYLFADGHVSGLTPAMAADVFEP